MFRLTDFGGFLVFCQIGHSYLNDVAYNSFAISLMLSLENAQIDWTKALGSFGFLPLRGAATGFVVVLPLPLIFDPPLYILHFTIYTTFHREATLKTPLELLNYSVKIRSQMQTITRAILTRNHSPGVSNSQRGRSCEQIFDSSTTFLNPLVGANSLYGKRTVGFFSLAKRALWACKARTLRAGKTLTPRFTNFFTDFEKKADCFAVYRRQEINK